jgi:hypothetical protein
MTTDRSLESRAYRKEEREGANKKYVARGYVRSILGATAVAKI